MGYSFSLPCHTQRHANQLADFLREYLRPFGLVCDEHKDKALEDLDWLEKNAIRFWPLPTATAKGHSWQNLEADRVCLGDELNYGSA